jgi:hypothetical protein
MNEEKTYPEVLQHCSLGSSIVSITSIPKVFPSSCDFLSATWRYHHPPVVKMIQVIQNLVVSPSSSGVTASRRLHHLHRLQPLPPPLTAGTASPCLQRRRAPPPPSQLSGQPTTGAGWADVLGSSKGFSIFFFFP